MKTRDYAYCGLFGALSLALPTLFHAFGLAGTLFLPMYWPLMALAFLVPARRAALVALVVPWASSVLTGMPLAWPPLAGVVSVELAVQVLALGWLGRPSRNCASAASGSYRRAFFALAAVLVVGRFLHAGLVWALALAFPKLPAGILAGASFLAGWPGVVAMLVFIPVFVASATRKDGVCEVRFLKALRRLRLPEGVVLVCAQALRWFEALSRDAEMLARALELRRVQGKDGRTPAAESAPAVRVENLRVQYATAPQPALALDSLTIAKGERVALLGNNGSGKTTLLSVLAGFVEYRGEVEVFGEAPQGKSLKSVRRRLGVLFENPDDQFIFPTVREDVGHAFAGRGWSQEELARKVDELLVSLGLPTGNRPIASLSRGQRQRVAIAGLLAAEPELLLLDEPTAALDETEKNRLAEVLSAQPAAVLVATHDRDFAERLGGRQLRLPVVPGN